MKVQKMICIDVELAEKLKEVNASELISDLLREHFKSRPVRTKEEIILELEKIRIKKEAEAKIQELENGRKN